MEIRYLDVVISKKSQKKISQISNFFEILRFEIFENLGQKNCHHHKNVRHSAKCQYFEV